MKLLIHHHAPVFKDKAGFHVQSFIGCWVKALSPYFEEIGLLLPEAHSKSVVQDTLVNGPNIRFYPLPLGGRRWDYFQRKKQIQRICRKVSPQYDVLLVRGITPRQWTVWQHCTVPQKAFFLVGSLLHNRPKFGFTLSEALTWALSSVRRLEFKKIAKGGLLLANSPLLAEEIRQFCQQQARFIPTNSLNQMQVLPVQRRDISQPCRLLFCGRVVPDKGIEELILALVLLNKETANSSRLVIIGPVEAVYKNYLEKRAAQIGVSAQLEWKGFIPFGEALLASYRQSDFMVLPSYHEGFPHSIWEAAANSVPVVTTRAGGIPGLVDDSMVTFIEKKSAVDIADKIIFLQEHPAKRWEKVEKLHAFAQQFTVESAAKQLWLALSAL